MVNNLYMTNNHTTTRTADIENARIVDTEVARLWGEFHKANDKLRYDRNQRTFFATSKAMNPALKADKVARIDIAIEALTAETTALYDAANNYDEANYTGWNRFYLVKHIHSNRYCSSFRPTTRIGWLPNVSGLTEVEAVAAHGETLCTICFKTAPTV